MTKKEISVYIKRGIFSTELLEPALKSGLLKWYYRDNKGVLHTGEATSRFTAMSAAESLGYNSND